MPIKIKNPGRMVNLTKPDFGRFKTKRTIVFAAAVLIIAGIVFGVVAWKKHKSSQKPENQPQVWEALVMIADQKTVDPVEDARSSLKKGDVIAYFPAGHPWSETEKISYLIVKIKLKPDEAAKLTEAKTKEVKRDVKADNGSNGESPSDARALEGKQTETVLARQYRLRLPGFDLQKFWGDHQQPFSDKVFSDSIIDKK